MLRGTTCPMDPAASGGTCRGFGMLDHERGRLLHEASELRSLAGRELVGELLELGDKRPAGALRRVLAFDGGFQNHDATVDGMLVAPDEPIALQTIDDAGHGAGAEPEHAACVARCDAV